jgi:uncharacterized protein YbjT (DUF2867 family)
MSSTQAAVVLGASGSVGNALIKELIRNGSFTPIVTLVRDRDVTEHAGEIGRLPLPRNDGVESVLSSGFAYDA